MSNDSDYSDEEENFYQEKIVTPLQRMSPKSNKKNSIDTKCSSDRSSYREKKENPLDKRRKLIDHNINPASVPRPGVDDEIFKDEDGENVYQTDMIPNEHIPFSNSSYNVLETENSSIRLIRPSMHILPTNMELMSKTGLCFGLNIQPFEELSDNGEGIPQVEVENGILRCKKCNTYINNKFKIIKEYSFNLCSEKVQVICNLCNSSTHITRESPDVKPEYFFSNTSSAIELTSPSINFCFSDTSNNDRHSHNGKFIVFAIDISYKAYTSGLCQYILESIQSNLCQLAYEKKSAKGCFITFDTDEIHFYYIDKKTKEAKVCIMRDKLNPFCPLPDDILFSPVDEKENVEKICERILSMSKKVNITCTYGSCINSCIYASFDAIKNLSTMGTSKIYLFSATKSSNGIMHFPEMDYTKLYATENEIRLFIPQHNFVSNLNEVFLSKRCSLEMFILGSGRDQIHLPNYFLNKINYYSVDETSVKEDLSATLEQLHYDLNKSLISKEYIDVQCILRCSPEFEVSQILYSGEEQTIMKNSIQMASVRCDLNLLYNVKIKRNLEEDKVYHFQFSVLYTNPENNTRNIRTINYSIGTTPNEMQVYMNLDNDCMTRIIVLNELVKCLKRSNNNVCAFERIRDNVGNVLTNTFAYYKAYVVDKLNEDTLVLPSSLRYLALYLYSFLKKPLMKKNKHITHPNQIFSFIYDCFFLPLNLFIKTLYPRLYRLDNLKVKDNDEDVSAQSVEWALHKKPNILPLSLDYIDLDMGMIHDDGKTLSLIILSEVSDLFIYENFGFDNYKQLEENVERNVLMNWNINDYFDHTHSSEEVNDFNFKISKLIKQLRRDNTSYYQPLKLILINEKTCLLNKFASLFIEDAYREDSSYIDFLCRIHNMIMKKLYEFE